MRYQIRKNGDIIMTTDSLKRASGEYNRAIYEAKSGDFIEVFWRKEPTDAWERIRKDWL